MSATNEFTVHPSSYVDDDVIIGRGTTIWHFCHLLSGVRLGEKCRVPSFSAEQAECGECGRRYQQADATIRLLCAKLRCCLMGVGS